MTAVGGPLCSRSIWFVDGGRGGLTCVWAVGEERGRTRWGRFCAVCVSVVWVWPRVT